MQPAGRAGIHDAADRRPEQAAAEAAQTVGAEPLRPDVTDPGSIVAAAHRQGHDLPSPRI